MHSTAERPLWDISPPVDANAPVFPGDILLADNGGVIPAHVAEEVAQEATEISGFEDFVQEQVAGVRPILGLYPPTEEPSLARYAEWLGHNGRYAGNP